MTNQKFVYWPQWKYPICVYQLAVGGIAFAVILGDVAVNGTKSPSREDRDEDGLTPAERIASEFLARDQDNWEMADQNHDGDLTVNEFLSFQHPEQNKQTVLVVFVLWWINYVGSVRLAARVCV